MIVVYFTPSICLLEYKILKVQNPLPSFDEMPTHETVANTMSIRAYGKVLSVNHEKGIFTASVYLCNGTEEVREFKIPGR